MALVGYARVSSVGQSLDVQLDKLKHCDNIYQEKKSGASGKRPRLEACLEYVREGDTLVVTRLDRQARSTLHLCQIADELKRKQVNLQVLDQNINTSVLLYNFITGGIREHRSPLLLTLYFPRHIESHPTCHEGHHGGEVLCRPGSSTATAPPTSSLDQSAVCTAINRSIAWVKKWKKRFREASPDGDSVLQGLSRRPHKTPEPIHPTVVERILHIRDHLPLNLQRTPGPKAIIYYPQIDEELQGTDLHLPTSTSTSTIWRILDQHGRIERPPPRQHEPLERPEPMTYWALDFNFT